MEAARQCAKDRNNGGSPLGRMISMSPGPGHPKLILMWLLTGGTDVVLNKLADVVGVGGVAKPWHLATYVLRVCHTKSDVSYVTRVTSTCYCCYWYKNVSIKYSLRTELCSSISSDNNKTGKNVKSCGTLFRC